MSDLIQIWTPTEISEYIANVSAGYDALIADFAERKVLDVTGAKAWGVLVASFAKWRKDLTYLEKLTLSPLRTAEQYAKQLQYWRDVYRAKTGSSPSGAMVDVPSDTSAAVVEKVARFAAYGLGAWVLVNVLKTARVFR